MQKAIVISAFPGTGKSYLTKHCEEIPDLRGITFQDSDSSNYSWIKKDGKKVRNPDFPANYIQHIKDSMYKSRIIFVSSHTAVRSALKQEGISFVSVYPDTDCKAEYLERYKKRGSPQSFIQNMDEMWDAFMTEARDPANMGDFRKTLEGGQYIDAPMIIDLICQIGALRAAAAICGETL